MLQIRPKNCLRVRKTAFIYDRDQTIIWYPCIMFLQCSLARRVGTTWWWANVISISIIFHFLIFTCTPPLSYIWVGININISLCWIQITFVRKYLAPPSVLSKLKIMTRPGLQYKRLVTEGRLMEKSKEGRKQALSGKFASYSCTLTNWPNKLLWNPGIFTKTKVIIAEFF